MKVLTAHEMRKMDAKVIHDYGIPGITLMDNAGQSVFSVIQEILSQNNDLPSGKHHVLLIAGKGNNGGDAFVVARYLAHANIPHELIILAPKDDYTGDARAHLERYISLRSNIHICSDSRSLRDATITPPTLVVDGILGTGLSKPVTGHYCDAITFINSFHCPVVAIDIPSGISADTGAPLGPYVRATHTVTMAYPKVGQFCGIGQLACGAITVADIGFPKDIESHFTLNIDIPQLSQCHALFPRRLPTAHKGTFGHVLIIGGSQGKSGACKMAAAGALRSGAGRVTLGVPDCIHPAVEAWAVEVMSLPLPSESGALSPKALREIPTIAQDKSAVIIGPGLSTAPHLISPLFGDIINQIRCPIVIDADGLNILAHTNILAIRGTSDNIILTPHPGEMGRLLDISTKDVQANRLSSAQKLAEMTGACVVLKGYRTIVAASDGRAAIITTGNPGMATAGSGDVLSGMIGGSLAAKSLSIFETTALTTLLHGHAGDIAARDVGPIGMTAKDIIRSIPQAIQEARLTRPVTQNRVAIPYYT